MDVGNTTFYPIQVKHPVKHLFSKIYKPLKTTTAYENSTVILPISRQFCLLTTIYGGISCET
jgi:hypothetical protein